MTSFEPFRIYFEHAPFSIQLLSPEGKTLAVNRAWKELWKIPDNVIIDYILKDYNVGDDPQLEIKGIRNFILKGLRGETVDIPAIYYDPAETGLEGDPKWVSGFMYPIKDETGRIVQIVLTHNNITNTKTAEEELRRSRDQLQIIFEGVADGILVQDKNYKIVYANNAGANLCGFATAEELLQASIESLVTKFELRDEKGDLITLERLPARLVLSGKGPQENVVMRVRNLQTEIETWSEVSSRPVLDEKNQPYLAVSIFRDITEEKKRQERQHFLSEATNILSASLDYRETLNRIAMLAVPELADWCSIDVVEEDGPHQVAVAHADPAMLKFAEELHLKYPPDWNAPTGSPNVLRTGVAEFYPYIPEELFEQAAQDAEHLEIIKKLGLKSAMVVPLIANDKILGAITFIGAESGRTYSETDLGMAKELGLRSALALENAKLYQKSETLADELQHAVRARDEFISICSHELKTPITSMKLQFQLAQRTDPSKLTPEVQQKRISDTNRQLDRMVKLIDEMLDVSRVNTGKLEMEFSELNLNDLVQDTLNRFTHQLENLNIKISFRSDSDQCLVSGDSFRLEQVFSNLITNALKYGNGNPIAITILKKGSVVHTRFEDNGIGIDQKDLERIFNRFERVASVNNVSGLGIGLYITKQIVIAHKGRIWAESKPTSGTIFVVELPLLNS